MWLHFMVLCTVPQARPAPPAPPLCSLHLLGEEEEEDSARLGAAVAAWARLGAPLCLLQPDASAGRGGADPDGAASLLWEAGLEATLMMLSVRPPSRLHPGRAALSAAQQHICCSHALAPKETPVPELFTCALCCLMVCQLPTRMPALAKARPALPPLLSQSKRSGYLVAAPSPLLLVAPLSVVQQLLAEQGLPALAVPAVGEAARAAGDDGVLLALALRPAPPHPPADAPASAGAQQPVRQEQEASGSTRGASREPTPDIDDLADGLWQVQSMDNLEGAAGEYAPLQPPQPPVPIGLPPVPDVKQRGPQNTPRGGAAGPGAKAAAPRSERQRSRSRSRSASTSRGRGKRRGSGSGGRWKRSRSASRSVSRERKARRLSGHSRSTSQHHARSRGRSQSGGRCRSPRRPRARTRSRSRDRRRSRSRGQPADLDLAADFRVGAGAAPLSLRMNSRGVPS